MKLRGPRVSKLLEMKNCLSLEQCYLLCFSLTESFFCPFFKVNQRTDDQVIIHEQSSCSALDQSALKIVQKW